MSNGNRQINVKLILEIVGAAATIATIIAVTWQVARDSMQDKHQTAISNLERELRDATVKFQAPQADRAALERILEGIFKAIRTPSVDPSQVQQFARESLGAIQSARTGSYELGDGKIALDRGRVALVCDGRIPIAYSGKGAENFWVFSISGYNYSLRIGSVISLDLFRQPGRVTLLEVVDDRPVLKIECGS